MPLTLPMHIVFENNHRKAQQVIFIHQTTIHEKVKLPATR